MSGFVVMGRKSDDDSSWLKTDITLNILIGWQVFVGSNRIHTWMVGLQTIFYDGKDWKLIN